MLSSLESGANESALREMLGLGAYAELRALAIQAQAARSERSSRRTRAPRVIIVPGIMGSRLGTRSSAGSRAQILWIDPWRIAAGGLADLALPRGNALAPLGVLLFAYAKMRYLLEIDGFDAQFFGYDWRRGLAESGRALASHISASARPTAVVGHSMGGLVARASLDLLPRRAVTRVILLGTPHRGTYAPVQALCGTYPTVRKLAMLDLRHSPEWLSKHVFSTFAGLYQLLPPPREAGVDLYDPQQWPTRYSSIDAELLREAAHARDSLAPADARFRQVLGVDQDTIVDVRRASGGFEYMLEPRGDGTVPLSSAFLSGVPAYYTQEQHGSLASNAEVIRCVADLIRSGRSTRLPRRRRPIPALRKTLTDDELRRQFNRKIDWRRLDSAQRARVMAELAGSIAEPAPAANRRRARTAAGGSPGPVSVQARFGDLAAVDAQTLVLGVFRNVRPGGAAASIDRRLNGLLAEYFARRMLPGDAGQLFNIPTGPSKKSRHRPALRHAANVLITGMGDFDRFDADVLRFISENVAHFLLRSGVSRFAAVLLGTGSGLPMEAALQAQLRGYFNALSRAGTDFGLQRIELFTNDRRRYAAMCAALDSLRASDAFADTAPVLSLRTPRLRATRKSAGNHAAARRAAAAAESTAQRACYLIVSQEQSSSAHTLMRASLLTSGAKAAIMTDAISLERGRIDALLQELPRLSNEAALLNFGVRLSRLVLPLRIEKVLPQVRTDHLVIVHDAELARLPWETLCIGSWAPAAARGLSRLYAAENLSVARWSEARRLGSTLDVLVVADPTEDLPGAKIEARRLIESMAGRTDVRLHIVQGREASRARLLELFASGSFDVLHYAGHAYFDAKAAARSGLLCAGREVLSGRDLRDLHSLPALVFFNACESGRIRGGLAAPRALATGDGLAESFLRGGVANYLGTYWPVGDSAALAFSTALYSAIVAGHALGEAVNRGRRAVREQRSIDWADYMHYGSYDFRLKISDGGGTAHESPQRPRLIEAPSK